MEAAFWSWTQDTPAAHIYGVYTSQHSCRTTIYHTREQLHSLQQTMYFDETTYPHLPPLLLDRILRIRALVKGKGKSPDTSDPTDDPTTSILQSELIHPYTPPQAMTQPCTTPPPVTTNITSHDHSQPLTPPTATTPDFPHTALAPRPTYTCMRSANSCISPPRPVNLFPTNPPPHTLPQQCDPTQVYNIRIPIQGHATLTALGPITAPPSSTSNSTPTIYYMPTSTNIRPNHPEAGIGPPGPWWDDAGAPP